MSKKNNHPEKTRYDLVLSKKLKYDIGELTNAIEQFKAGKTPKELGPSFKTSANQMKLLYFIYKKGNEKDLLDALSNQCYMSKIKKEIQERKTKTRQ